MRNQRAGVEDRWHNSAKQRTSRYGKGKRWLARWVDDTGRETSKSFDRKADAQAHIDSIVTAQGTGTYVDPARGKTTLDTFYSDWADRQVWVESTRYAVDLAMKDLPFGAVPLVNLRASHLEAWVKQMQVAGLAPSTIKTRFGNCRSVIRAALADRLLPRDVTAGIKLPRQRKAAAAMQIPTSVEVGAVLAAAHGTKVEAYVAVAAFTGMRLSEVLGLQVGDIDFMRREINVTRQAIYPKDGSGLVIRPPKYGSERTVYIPDGLVRVLSEHVRNHLPDNDSERWMFAATFKPEQPGHWVTWSGYFRKLRTATKVSFRFHDLRHYYASGLIAAGCDVVTVQRALGHSSASVTLDTYSHLWPNADDRTRSAAAAMFDEAAANPAAAQAAAD